MPNYNVSRIELNQDDTISIQVNVYDFDVGEPIEISGYVTQANGAAAAFYSVQEVPAHDQDYGAGIWIKSGPAVSSIRFDAGFPITVIARVAQVLVATLEPDASPAALPELQGPPGGYEILGAAWRSNDFGPAVSPARPPENGLGGDQSGD